MMPFAVAKCETTVMLGSPLTWSTRSRGGFSHQSISPRRSAADAENGSRQRLRQVREGPLQAKPHGAVVGRRHLIGRIHQRIGEDDARRKASDAGDDVPCQHRLVVMEPQTVAQLQGPGQSVLLDGMAL